MPQWVDRVKKIDTLLESRDTVYYYSRFKKHPVKRRSRSGRKRCNSNAETKRVRRRTKIKLLFKGRLSELVEKFEAAGEVIDTVRSVFAGAVYNIESSGICVSVQAIAEKRSTG